MRGLSKEGERFRIQFNSTGTSPGKRYRERLAEGTTRRQAEAYLGKLREDDRLGQLVWPSERAPEQKQDICSIGDFAIEVYLPHCAARNAPSTMRTKKQRLTSVSPWFLEVPIDSVTPALVAQYQRERKAEGVRNHTINLGWGTIRELLQLAFELEYIGRPPPLIRLLPATDSKPHRALTPEEAERALANAADAGSIWHCVALFMLHTGARWGDMMGLRWEDIDLDAGLVRFRAATAKHRKVREVPLLPEVMEALQALPREHERVFVRRCRNTGELITLKQSPKVFGRQKYPWEGRDTDLHVGPHVFRHTFATWRLRAGVSIALVSRWLGHANIQMTVDTYGHLETANSIEEIGRSPRPQVRRLRVVGKD